MCLIAWRWLPDSAVPLIWAANRDEFAHRATGALQIWPARHQSILSGIDLALEPSTHAGTRLWGTWAGVNDAGQFAWLTNIRSPKHANPLAPSRGLLVSEYLSRTDSPGAYLERVQAQAHRFNGFNLVLGQLGVQERAAVCLHFNSATTKTTVLESGVYGLSNADLDTPWPKTRALVGDLAMQAAAQLGHALDQALDTEPLFQSLANTRRYSGDEVPTTGVPIKIEHVLSSAFIAADIRGTPYGTRSSTVGWAKEGAVHVAERSFDTQGVCNNTVEHTLVFP